VEASEASLQANPSVGSARDYLELCLREWSASHALLRAIECRKLALHDLPSPVLDIGCGDGRLAGMLFDHPLAVGIDVNAKEVKSAQASGMYGRAVACDARRLPLPDQSFASVFSNCVLEHIPDLDQALAEISRVLKPDGRLLTTVPLPEWEAEGPVPLLRRWGMGWACRLMNPLLRHLWKHVTLEGREQWEARLTRAGLQLVTWEPYMGRHAFNVYGICLPGAFLSLVFKRTLGRSVLSRRLRRKLAPALARRLRPAFLADDAHGVCALVLAIKR